MRRRWLLGRLERIEGVDDLLPCWLADLARWAERHPGLPGFVDAVAIREGLLLPRLYPFTSRAGAAAVWLRVLLNRAIYPSVGRPLRREQRARLLAEREAGPPRGIAVGACCEHACFSIREKRVEVVEKLDRYRGEKAKLYGHPLTFCGERGVFLARAARLAASVVRRVSSERRHSEIGCMMEALDLRYCSS